MPRRAAAIKEPVAPVPTRDQVNARTLLLLEEMERLLRDPERAREILTTESFARRADGAKVTPSSPDAVRWDLMGLLIHVRHVHVPPVVLPPGTADEGYFQALTLLQGAAQAHASPGQSPALVHVSDQGGSDAVYRVVALALTQARALAGAPCPPASGYPDLPLFSSAKEATA